MALTNQPYIPLYVRDWLTSNKLKMCSASAHGLLINVMCIMHKEDHYGTLLLKQNFKQSSSTPLNFASMLARLLPFDVDEIAPALQELLDEGVLQIYDDLLVCKRMVDDADLSSKRAGTGSKGGKKTQSKYKKGDDVCLSKTSSKLQANVQANAEYENANENEDEFASEFDLPVRENSENFEN